LHDTIRRVLAEEDALEENQPKKYGVREHPDFREQADSVGAELTERGEQFMPIAW
jgi:hypothetical protein